MTSPARRPRHSYDDYVEIDGDSLVKHEFDDGQIYAMAGGSPAHAELAANVIALLRAALRGRGCHVYSSDLRVRVLATGLATYPDVTVICGEPAIDPGDRRRQTATNPSLLVEVLSPSTEVYDRGDKLDHYRRIETLREVVLVAHDRIAVAVWRRTPSGWMSEEVVAGALRLETVGGVIELADIYGEVVPGGPAG